MMSIAARTLGTLEGMRKEIEVDFIRKERQRRAAAKARRAHAHTPARLAPQAQVQPLKRRRRSRERASVGGPWRATRMTCGGATGGRGGAHPSRGRGAPARRAGCVRGRGRRAAELHRQAAGPAGHRAAEATSQGDPPRKASLCCSPWRVVAHGTRASLPSIAPSAGPRAWAVLPQRCIPFRQLGRMR